jgi:hypothetical protein
MSDDLPKTTSIRDDWPARATETLVGYVDKVRAATTGKALTVTRMVVYFLAAGLISVVAFVVLLILLIRLLVAVTAVLPVVGRAVDEGESWLAYLILGVVFLGVGALLWRKKGA